MPVGLAVNEIATKKDWSSLIGLKHKVVDTVVAGEFLCGLAGWTFGNNNPQ